MDASFPIILIHKNDKKKGSLKELTLSELTKETTRLFREECKRCDVKYWAESDADVQIEDDEDIDAEYSAINGDSDDDDDDEYDSDDSDNEPKTKRPLRIRLTFSVKKIIIRTPKPVAVRATNIRSTTAIFEWILGTHKLDRKQVSSLSFEIQQRSPQNTLLVAKCNPTVGPNERYQIKLSGLHPNTNYKFNIRSVLQHENNNIYSDTCAVFEFDTCAINNGQNNIPRSISAPTELQVIALYPDSVILSWNHSNASLLNKYDYEYYIEEQDVFAGEICAATEDNNFIKIVQLSPSTQYTFVCKSKYYDPEREISDIYYNQIISSPTNSVTITTPEYKTNISDYKTRTIDKPRWVKRGNELELFWSAPESFYGKIEYEIIDKIQNKIIGTARKLPVIISTGDNKSIFGTKSGKYVITVRPILVNDADYDEKVHVQRVQCKSHDIQITIDDEKEDYSSESMLELSIRYASKNMQRTIKIDTRNCDFESFKRKLLFQFKLANQKLKISIRIPSGNNNNLQSMDINDNNAWQSFINNHSEKFLRQHKQAYCFIETMMDAPQGLSVGINEKSNQFEIDFKSEKAQKYSCEIECKKDPSSTSYIDLGAKYNQISTNLKPLIYKVESQYKYYYFRFKIKCRNMHIDSGYSQWTKWCTLNINVNKTPKKQIQSPLQSNNNNRNNNNYNSGPLGSPVNNINSAFGFPSSSSASSQQNNNNNNTLQPLNNNAANNNNNNVANNNNNSINSFGFASAQQMPLTNNNSNSSLEDLNYSAANNNQFWQTF